MGDNDLPPLDIPRPCPVAWSAMSGTDAARRCDRCQRVVHDFTVLSVQQIQALMSDPSMRVCARMDWSTAQRLGTNPLKALALSTMLTTAGLVAAAQPTDASTSSSTNIRGVLHEGDRPLSDVEVRAKHDGGGKVTVTRTDERGAYAFRDLAPGLYVISFASRGAQPVSSDIGVEVCKGRTVVLDSTPPESMIGEVIAVSSGPGVIAGHVTSQKLDDGLSGATVSLVRSDDGLRRTTKTDASGGYMFAGLKPGHYELSGAAEGFVTRSVGFDLKGEPHISYSSPGPNTIDPGDLAGDIALCPEGDVAVATPHSAEAGDRAASGLVIPPQIVVPIFSNTENEKR